MDLFYVNPVSRGWKEVLISGQRAPVVNYCMDGILVDITDIDSTVQEMDEAVIIGCQGNEEITWEKACNNINLSPDEQLQRVTERLIKNYFYEK